MGGKLSLEELQEQIIEAQCQATNSLVLLEEQRLHLDKHANDMKQRAKVCVQKCDMKQAKIMLRNVHYANQQQVQITNMAAFVHRKHSELLMLQSQRSMQETMSHVTTISKSLTDVKEMTRLQHEASQYMEAQKATKERTHLFNDLMNMKEPLEEEYDEEDEDEDELEDDDQDIENKRKHPVFNMLTQLQDEVLAEQQQAINNAPIRKMPQPHAKSSKHQEQALMKRLQNLQSV